jgi:hypothetical protein
MEIGKYSIGDRIPSPRIAKLYIGIIKEMVREGNMYMGIIKEMVREGILMVGGLLLYIFIM